VTSVVGVRNSRGEAAIDDGKFEVDNVTLGIVDDIPVDTTVGENNAQTLYQSKRNIHIVLKTEGAEILRGGNF